MSDSTQHTNALTGVLSSNPEGLSSNPRAALKGGA
jgi:hypothetical protein